MGSRSKPRTAGRSAGSPGHRAAKRLRGQDGFLLFELQLGMVLAVAVLLPAALLMIGAIRGEARTQTRYQSISEAQRGLEQMARELREASEVDGIAPSGSFAGLPYSTQGITNTIKAYTVIKTAGPARRWVTYTCGWVVVAYAPITGCRSTYTGDDGITVTRSYLPWNDYWSPKGARPKLTVWPPTPEAISDFGVFTLTTSGQVDTTKPADYVQLRVTLCVQSQVCNQPDSTKAVVLQTGVAPRNT